MRTEKEKMIAGDLYSSTSNEVLKQDLLQARQLLFDFNHSAPNEQQKRHQIISMLFQQTPASFFIEPPFRCDYGFNISIGEGFYANFDCIMLDGAPIRIGERVCFGPRVGLYTANHPIDKDIRALELEFSSPITIGDDVWLGGNVVVMPGITIGSNVIVGAGSVVTKDIPSNVIAVGNPCQVLRDITTEDKKYWQQQKKNYELERG